jgi:hypothetical protein
MHPVPSPTPEAGNVDGRQAVRQAGQAMGSTHLDG